MKKLLALLFAFGLIAAACGSTADVASDAADEVTDAVDGEEEAMEDDEEAMADGPEELNVGYFAGWPLPPQIGQEDGSFAAAVGVETVNWIPFDSGNGMAEGMNAGDIDISYSIGLTPFANSVNSGSELSLIGIAVAYADADNCIVQGDLGLTRENAAEVLNGQTVQTPIGNVTHFKMLSIMDFLGVDIDTVNVVPAESGAATAAAFQAGDIQVGCAFGQQLVDMTDAGGVPILTGAETESEVGIRTFDVNAIPDAFGEAHPELVVSFLQAVEDFTATWDGDQETNNPIIATAAGMEDVGNFLGGEQWFSFPTASEQLTDEWMGGVADVMKTQVDFFVEQGQVDSALGDFSGFVDTSFLDQVESR